MSQLPPCLGKRDPDDGVGVNRDGVVPGDRGLVDGGDAVDEGVGIGGQPEQPISTSATTFAFVVAHCPHCTPGPRSGVTGMATCAASLSVSHCRARTKPSLGDWSVAGYQVNATDRAWRATSSATSASGAGAAVVGGGTGAKVVSGAVAAGGAAAADNDVSRGDVCGSCWVGRHAYTRMATRHPGSRPRPGIGARSSRSSFSCGQFTHHITLRAFIPPISGASFTTSPVVGAWIMRPPPRAMPT